MIITSRNEKVYKVEMTESQAADLQVLLESGESGHVNELEVAELYGSERADSVHETLNNLHESLKGR